MVRFGELFLKSEPVRRQFMKILVNNLHAALNGPSPDHQITVTRSRILISGSEIPNIIQILTHVYGIADASVAIRTGITLDLLCHAAVALAQENLVPGMRFAVRARREGVEGFTSQSLAAEAGSRIIDVITDLKVDLNNPDYEIFIEARADGGLIYDKRLSGPGGLPYGTQGDALALLSAGIDSPVAAWLMMRRGVKVTYLHIDPDSWGGADIPIDLIQNLSSLSLWTPGIPIQLIILPGFALYSAIMGIREPRYRCVLCKRSMHLLAEYYALMNGFEGIITGDNLGQVATQTLKNIGAIAQGVSIPIFRPLIGYDKEEIIRLARSIGTYNPNPGDTSCKVLPQKPATAAGYEKIDQIIEENNIRSFFPELTEHKRIINVKDGVIL